MEKAFYPKHDGDFNEAKIVSTCWSFINAFKDDFTDFFLNQTQIVIFTLLVKSSIAYFAYGE